MKNNEVKNDCIMEQGNKNYWSDTTVVYGPIAQLIFSGITKISSKNVNICIIIFKIVNLLIHILNCFIIYKIFKKLKYVIAYGLNPFVLLEFLGMVHNDIIVVFFILVSLYFIVRKQWILPSIISLAIGAGIKYFPILLLPLVIIYHYRGEKKITKRILRCIEYGIIFAILILLEYAIFYKDMNIFTAMLVQNEKFSKSIYSGIIGLGELNGKKEITIFEKTFSLWQLTDTLRKIVFIIFVILYLKFCIDLLTEKQVDFEKYIKKYNYLLIIFLLSLGTFQQWYIVWLFATCFWQKTNSITNLAISASIASEFANSIYMFNAESYRYDIYFWGILILVIIGIKIIKFLKKY